MANHLERQALDVLARHPDGCAEAVLLADGFTLDLLSGLVIDELCGRLGDEVDQAAW
jgi:hypothetical protein